MYPLHGATPAAIWYICTSVLVPCNRVTGRGESNRLRHPPRELLEPLYDGAVYEDEGVLFMDYAAVVNAEIVRRELGGR